MATYKSYISTKTPPAIANRESYTDSIASHKISKTIINDKELYSSTSYYARSRTKKLVTTESYVDSIVSKKNPFHSYSTTINTSESYKDH